MKVTREQETVKDLVWNMYSKKKMSHIEIAEELGIKNSQANNIISMRKHKESFGEPTVIGICFGPKLGWYNDSKNEMDHHSSYTPTFSWEELSYTERCMEINPEHLIDFKQTLQRLKG